MDVSRGLLEPKANAKRNIPEDVEDIAEKAMKE